MDGHTHEEAEVVVVVVVQNGVGDCCVGCR